MFILYGLGIMGLGFLIVYKSEWIFSNFGSSSSFEKIFGPGGSRLGYKLVGIAMMFIGLMILTGMFSGLLRWILSPLLRYSTY